MSELREALDALEEAAKRVRDAAETTFSNVADQVNAVVDEFHENNGGNEVTDTTTGVATTNGDVTNADGSVTHADGTVTRTDGVVVNAQGQPVV